MQFPLTKLFAVVAAAAIASAAPASKSEANGATASPITPAVSPSPDDFNVGMVWTDANMGGTAGVLDVGGIPSGCENTISPFIDSISSIMVDSGIRCDFFVDTNCGGAVLTVADGGFVADLQGTNFQDSISSFSCFAN